MPVKNTPMFVEFVDKLADKCHEAGVNSVEAAAALSWDGEFATVEDLVAPGLDDHELDLARTWLRSRGNTIEGGTTEIQLNIIAKRVLGLPD